MVLKQLGKSWCMCIGVMMFGTLGFIIVHIAAEWMSYKEGYVNLWAECTHGNQTDRQTKPPDVCRNTTTSGPVWLTLCRTMACLTLVLFVYTHVINATWPHIAHPKTLKEHIQTRMIFVVYFVIGAMMLATALIFHTKYKAYYTEKGIGEEIQPGFALIVAFVGGTVAIINCVILWSQYDTGLKAYLNKKLCKCGSGSASQRGGNTNVEVKSRFARLVNGLKNCVRKTPKSADTNDRSNNNNSNNNDNQSRTTRVTTSGRMSGQTAVNVAPRSDETPTNEIWNSSVFVIGVDTSQSDFLSPAPCRIGSAASARQLDVGVRSVSGGENHNISNGASHVKLPPLPPPTPPQYTDVTVAAPVSASVETRDRSSSVLSCSSGQEQDPHAPPPSYEEVMMADS